MSPGKQNVDGIARGRRITGRALRVTTLIWNEKDKLVTMRTTNPTIIKQIRSYLFLPGSPYKETATKEYANHYTIAEFQFPMKCIRFWKPRTQITPERRAFMQELGRKMQAKRIAKAEEQRRNRAESTQDERSDDFDGTVL